MEDITDIRRARLKDWFANRPYPVNKSSYYSQLINDHVAFGERAARKIEQDCRMPPMSLDQPYGQSNPSFAIALDRASLLDKVHKRVDDLPEEKLKALAIILDISV